MKARSPMKAAFSLGKTMMVSPLVWAGPVAARTGSPAGIERRRSGIGLTGKIGAMAGHFFISEGFNLSFFVASLAMIFIPAGNPIKPLM
jgi:hypothetical protein